MATSIQGFDGILDDVLGVARQIIPSGTVVGNAIGSTRPKGSTTQAVVESISYPPPTGATAPQPSAMPSWVMPVAIGGGVLLIAMLFMPKRR